MAKKKFVLNKSIDSGLHKAVEHSKSEAEKYHNVILPISDIEIDESNPRNLLIRAKEIELVHKTNNIKLPIQNFDQLEELSNLILNKLTDTTNDQEIARIELSNLIELAHSIMSQGLIHPILVYKTDERYRIVAGERRYLTHLILGKEYIQARAYLNTPNGLVVKIAQWVENIEREDLSPYAKVVNIQQIIKEIKKSKTSEVEPTPTQISEISSLPKSSASYYLRAAKAPKDVLDALEEGKIPSIRKAATIAGEKSIEKRRQLILACTQGISETELAQAVKPIKNSRKQRKKVNLGSIDNPNIAKRLVEAIIVGAKLNDIETEIDWTNCNEISKLFKKVIKELEG